MFADRIKLLIGKKSVNSFAQKCGVTESLVRKWLSGSLPRLDNLVQVAKTAEVSMEWLATGEGQMRPKARQEEDIKEEKSEDRRIIEYGRRRTDQPLSPPMRLTVEALLYLEKEDPAGFMLLTGKIIEREEKSREYEELKKMGTGDA